jgi:RND family efflux transporter MFP subunit
MNYETTIDTHDAATLGSFSDEGDGASRGSSRKVWLIGLVVVLVLAAVWFMSHRTGDVADGADRKSAQAQSVSAVTPGRTTIQATISANGTIAARREMPVGVAGEGGQVVQVMVDAGDWVGAGQVLAVIDRSVQTQQVANGAANVSVSEADARLAQANLDRALKLVDRGFISKADVDRLTATRDAAAARVRVARASLGELNARSARLNIVAPAAGLVLARNVEPGQIVGSASGILFRIAKGGEMEMQARLSESDLARLSVGTAADVTPVGTTTHFTGQIWQLSPTIDTNTREGIARVALPYDAALRPGGFASATISSGTVTAPVLPESAILSDDRGAFVYVIGGGNKIERRVVKTGDVTPRGIVVSEGLAGNERIVLRAGGFLNPGDVVRPVAARPAPGA